MDLSEWPRTTDDGDPTRARRVAHLLARVASGDVPAFAALYDETASRVFGVALSVLGDQAEAERVTVETYVQVQREAGLVVDGERSLSWMLTLAHGNATSRARRPLSSVAWARARARDDGAARGSAARHRVSRALEGLPTVQRESLELAYFGGYTRSEVALMTRTSGDVVSSGIRDGLIQLRGVLEDVD